tara:strand:+ start:181 stop:609 length:429 start_codon:yes stop_codon:yes gene_type:complete
MNLIIKEINTPEDLIKVFKLRIEVFTFEQNCPIEEEFDLYDNLSKSTQFIVENEGECIGMEQRAMMEELESSNRYAVYEEEKCYIGDDDQVRGLFGNYEIGTEIDCDFSDNLVQRFEDPTNLAMLGLMVTVGATLLQMVRGN